MKKLIPLSCIVFVLAVVLAFCFEDNYQILVRFFIHLFNGNQIKFIGKNFHLFASYKFVISFGLYSVLLFSLLFIQSKKDKLLYTLFAFLLFVGTTMFTVWIDGFGKIVECTACNDGIRLLGYNEINYDLHFILSLSISLLPIILHSYKRRTNNKTILKYIEPFLPQ